MSGYDRSIIAEELIGRGWFEAKEGFMIPPDELLDRAKGKMFYVYEAEELQSMLDNLSYANLHS